MPTLPAPASDSRMPTLSVKIEKMPDFPGLAKQVPFAAALALTRTAQDAQKAVLTSLEKNFTLRGNWAQPSNKFGIRITPATKQNLTAEVKTAADWLALHETGADKKPRGKMLAIPTGNVRRNNRQIIPRAQRPAALRTKRTVILNTKSGPVLFQRQGRGKNKKLVPLYVLNEAAKIKKRPTFYAPAWAAAREKLQENFREALNKALATAK